MNFETFARSLLKTPRKEVQNL